MKTLGVSCADPRMNDAAGQICSLLKRDSGLFYHVRTGGGAMALSKKCWSEPDKDTIIRNIYLVFGNDEKGTICLTGHGGRCKHVYENGHRFDCSQKERNFTIRGLKQARAVIKKVIGKRGLEIRLCFVCFDKEGKRILEEVK